MIPINLKISIPEENLKDLILKITSIANTSNFPKEPIELLTIQEVSRKLKVNKNSVYSLIRKGHLQALKLGSLKVTSKELERFIIYASGKDFSDLDNVKPLENNI